MGLKEEIEARASKIYRESYQMSIGELINLYKDGEMDIHPEFQRVFRWSESQKTKLIESMLMYKIDEAVLYSKIIELSELSK